MNRLSDRWLWFILSLCFTTTLAAQDELKAKAREACKTARQMAAREDWDGAQKMLQLQREALGADAKSAAAIIRFTSAWLHEARADGLEKNGTKDAAKRELQLAIPEYKHILEDYPKNGQAAVNFSMLLERLGQADDAIRVLQMTIERGSTDAFRLSLAVGDAYIRQGQAQKAWLQFKKLGENDHYKDRLGVHERMIRLYGRLPERNDDGFFKYCLKLKDEGFQRLAGEGMGEIVNLSWKTSPKIAEGALLEWTEQKVREDQLGAEDLRRFPTAQEWESKSLSGLRQLVSGNPEAADWWLRDPKRKHSASGVLRLRAEQLAKNDQVDRAIKVYQTAIAIAPDLSEYANKQNTALTKQIAAGPKAAASMAHTIYKAVGKLDAQSKENDDPRTNAKLKQKIKEFNGLLDSKQLNGLLERQWDKDAGNYQSGAVDGIHQYHMTLGAIHSERRSYKSANLHLERLVKVEQAEAKIEQRPPRPQPQVALLLADGFRATADHKAAAEQYRIASKGYLLENDEASALASLAKLRNNELTGEAIRDSSLIKRSIELQEKLMRKNGDPESAEWKQLERLHTPPGDATTGAKSEWGQQYLRSVTERAEMKVRKAGDREKGEAWKRESEKLPAKSQSIKLDKATELRLESLRHAPTTKTRSGVGR